MLGLLQAIPGMEGEGKEKRRLISWVNTLERVSQFTRVVCLPTRLTTLVRFFSFLAKILSLSKTAAVAAEETRAVIKSFMILHSANYANSNRGSLVCRTSGVPPCTKFGQCSHFAWLSGLRNGFLLCLAQQQERGSVSVQDQRGAGEGREDRPNGYDSLTQLSQQETTHVVEDAVPHVV